VEYLTLEPILNLEKMLFESFSTSFNAASWPSSSTMSREAALKSVKKSFKNQIFRISR
jgi:hypothetical protein